jgi:hypothetical protein
LTRNKLYLLFISLVTAGYIWLVYSFKTVQDKEKLEMCFIKQISGVPCPSCGTTRSVIAITKGNYLAALNINPLGYLVITIMLIVPVWICVDLLLKKQTLLTYYKKAEQFLKKPPVAIVFILLLIVNWIWNIYKRL